MRAYIAAAAGLYLTLLAGSCSARNDGALPAAGNAQAGPASEEALTRFVEKGMAFVHGQRITDRRVMKGRCFTGLYQSFKEDPRNPDSRYIAKYGRVWIYDQAIAVYAELKYGHRDHARECVAALLRLADDERARGFRGLWHFSYNTRDDDFVDPRGPLGANLWALSAILAYMDATGDVEHLPRVNALLRSYVFPQQVTEAGDPRRGLFRAGLENPVDLARGDTMGYHVYEGVPSDFEEILHKNQRLSQVMLGFILPRPLNQPVGAIDAALQAARPVDEIINSQVEFCSIEHNADAIATLRLAERVNRRFGVDRELLGEIRRRHDRVMAALDRFWVRDENGEGHFVTGMNPDGTLNRSVAVDNNQWVAGAVLPFDEERAWQCIQYTRRHFWTQDEGFAGLFFFEKTFLDKYVEMPEEDRERLERMIQPEATWGYVSLLRQFALRTKDPRRKAEAEAMMHELSRSMIGFQEQFARNEGRYARGMKELAEMMGKLGEDVAIGVVNEPRRAIESVAEEIRGSAGYHRKLGTPYASTRIQNYFTTLEGIAGTATGVIVALEMLGRNDDDFIGVRPSAELSRSAGASPSSP
jgi:hypothetical protein